ncbi:MAG: hypothetical protein JXR84_04555 [Anaerolineae bacterium]|nr:hypothetical protein [Anaerolineae bacterium]
MLEIAYPRRKGTFGIGFAHRQELRTDQTVDIAEIIFEVVIGIATIGINSRTCRQIKGETFERTNLGTRAGSEQDFDRLTVFRNE